MTSTHNFDYDDYMRGFRAACERRGIDPRYGASGYQVVHITVERRRAEWRAARTAGAWWARHELWMDCPPYRSETEQDALWALFSESYGRTILRVLRAKRRWRAAMSLRELHQCQRRRIK